MSSKKDCDKKPSKAHRDAGGKYAKRDGAGKFVKRAEHDADIPGQQVTLGQRNAPTEEQALVGTYANEAREPARQAQQFPTNKLSAAEKEDRINRVKYDLQRQEGNDTGVTPFGVMTWNDKYAEWYLRKLEAKKKAAFQQWFAVNFDKWGPAQKKLARELYPQFYKERVETLDQNLEMAKKIAKLKILGPQTSTDVALQFALDQGMIHKNVLENLINPNQTNLRGARAEFQRGRYNTNNYLFHTRTPMTEQQITEAQNAPPSIAAIGGNRENAAVLRRLGFTT